MAGAKGIPHLRASPRAELSLSCHPSPSRLSRDQPPLGALGTSQLVSLPSHRLQVLELLVSIPRTTSLAEWAGG